MLKYLTILYGNGILQIQKVVMGRKSTILKNRVYVECTDANRRVKAVIINKTETNIKVLLPTGFVMTLERRNKSGIYLY
jgi:hypothetical protein